MGLDPCVQRLRRSLRLRIHPALSGYQGSKTAWPCCWRNRSKPSFQSASEGLRNPGAQCPESTSPQPEAAGWMEPSSCKRAAADSQSPRWAARINSGGEGLHQWHYHLLQLLAFGQQGKVHLLAQIVQAGFADCAVGVVHKGGLDLISQRFWVVDVGLQHGAVDKEGVGLKAFLRLAAACGFRSGRVRRADCRGDYVLGLALQIGGGQRLFALKRYSCFRLLNLDARP